MHEKKKLPIFPPNYIALKISSKMDAALIMILIMLSGFGINNFFRDFLGLIVILLENWMICIKAALFVASVATLALIIYENFENAQYYAY